MMFERVSAEILKALLEEILPPYQKPERVLKKIVEYDNRIVESDYENQLVRVELSDSKVYTIGKPPAHVINKALQKLPPERREEIRQKIERALNTPPETDPSYVISKLEDQLKKDIKFKVHYIDILGQERLIELNRHELLKALEKVKERFL